MLIVYCQFMDSQGRQFFSLSDLKLRLRRTVRDILLVWGGGGVPTVLLSMEMFHKKRYIKAKIAIIVCSALNA